MIEVREPIDQVDDLDIVLIGDEEPPIEQLPDDLPPIVVIAHYGARTHALGRALGRQ